MSVSCPSLAVVLMVEMNVIAVDDEYDLVEVTNVTTQTPEAKAKQQALLGVLRQGVLQVIGDLQQETVLGVFTINGLSKRTIMKRPRKVKAHSEACWAFAS